MPKARWPRYGASIPGAGRLAFPRGYNTTGSLWAEWAESDREEPATRVAGYWKYQLPNFRRVGDLWVHADRWKTTVNLFASLRGFIGLQNFEPNSWFRGWSLLLDAYPGLRFEIRSPGRRRARSIVSASSIERTASRVQKTQLIPSAPRYRPRAFPRPKSRQRPWSDLYL
jgi:hypothetical protein